MADFSYVGFAPTVELRRDACRELDLIMESAPALSSVEAVLMRLENNVFRGWLRIAGMWDRFSAEASGIDPTSVMKSLYEQAGQRICDWRSHRELEGDASGNHCAAHPGLNLDPPVPEEEDFDGPVFVAVPA